jgi:hypothetical protein
MNFSERFYCEHIYIRGCIQKFPDCPPGARTANATALCHWVQLHRYFVSQSSEFCRHNPLYCLSTSVYCCYCLFRYRLSPKTFGYTLVLVFTAYWLESPSKYSPGAAVHLVQQCCHCWKFLLLTNFQCRHHILFYVFSTVKSSSVPLRQTLFLETARSHSEPNQVNRVDVPLQ